MKISYPVIRGIGFLNTSNSISHYSWFASWRFSQAWNCIRGRLARNRGWPIFVKWKQRWKGDPVWPLNHMSVLRSCLERIHIKIGFWNWFPENQLSAWLSLECFWLSRGLITPLEDPDLANKVSDSKQIGWAFLICEPYYCWLF